MLMVLMHCRNDDRSLQILVTSHLAKKLVEQILKN